MADLVAVSWYATIAPQGLVRRRRRQRSRRSRCATAPPSTRSTSHNDDRYKITQMTWFDSKDDWYRYWDGPEMIEFRARNWGATRSRSRYCVGRRDRRRRARPGGARCRARAGARAARRSRGLTPGRASRRVTPTIAAASRPQRELEPEARVGVVERLAEQLAQPAQPVARGLGMDPEPLRHLPEPSLLGEPRRSVSVSRCRDPGDSARQRRQPVGGEFARRAPVAAQQQLAGALAGRHQPGRRRRRARARPGRARS